MDITPLFNRVVLKAKAMPEKIGLLYIPQTSKQSLKHWFKADVVAVGPDVKQLKKGDIVLVDSYGGSIMEVDGDKFILIEDKHVGCKLTGKGRLIIPDFDSESVEVDGGGYRIAE